MSEKYNCWNQPTHIFMAVSKWLKHRNSKFIIFLLTLDGQLCGSILFASYDFIHQDGELSKEWKTYLKYRRQEVL